MNKRRLGFRQIDGEGKYEIDNGDEVIGWIDGSENVDKFKDSVNDLIESAHNHGIGTTLGAVGLSAIIIGIATFIKGYKIWEKSKITTKEVF